MIRCFYIIVALLLSQNALGQVNLIPNPGFELYDTCPSQLGQIGYLNNWFPVTDTPDYYNACSAVISVPNNPAGYQPDLLGSAYCGLVCFYPIANAREYFGVQLINSLSVGVKYYISFYLSLSGYNFTLSCNKFGCKLSTVPFVYNSVMPDNQAMFHTDSIVSDTTNWVFIKGSFIADSAYQYIAFGNFFDDLNTDTLGVGMTNTSTYYYFDNVCITTDSTLCNDITSFADFPDQDINSLIIMPNPSTGEFSISADKNISKIELFDGVGKMVAIDISNLTGESQEFSINLKRNQKDIYYLHTLVGSTTVRKKIIVQ